MARRVEDRSSFIAADSSALSETAPCGVGGLAARSFFLAPVPVDRRGKNAKDHGMNRVNVFIGQIP